MSKDPIIAIVRPPTEALTSCELTHLEREPLDFRRALAQHRGYTDLLRQLGAEVISLAPEEALPDAVFVEDVALVLDELAILTNPGAASRRPEVESVAGALKRHRPILRMAAPATLDGGDVIVAGRTLYVGRSSRTNAAGLEQLASFVGAYGYSVRAVPVTGCLHLKSACTYAGAGVFLLNPAWVDPAEFDAQTVLEVPATESRGANTFRVGAAIVMAHGFPGTRTLLERHGFHVHTVDLSELQKAEAGGSCMSLIFRGPSQAERGHAPGATPFVG